MQSPASGRGGMRNRQTPAGSRFYAPRRAWTWGQRASGPDRQRSQAHRVLNAVIPAHVALWAPIIRGKRALPNPNPVKALATSISRTRPVQTFPASCISPHIIGSQRSRPDKKLRELSLTARTCSVFPKTRLAKRCSSAREYENPATLRIAAKGRRWKWKPTKLEHTGRGSLQ